MKPKKTLKSVVALSLAVLTLFSALPTAFAAQQNSYQGNRVSVHSTPRSGGQMPPLRR